MGRGRGRGRGGGPSENINIPAPKREDDGTNAAERFEQVAISDEVDEKLLPVQSRGERLFFLSPILFLWHQSTEGASNGFPLVSAFPGR